MRKPEKRYPGLVPGRWGCNDQPSIYTVCHVLGLLPVDFVDMPSPDTLVIRFYRKLTFYEAFILGRMNPDLPSEGIDENMTEIKFWWD